MKNTIPILATALLIIVGPCVARADVKMPSIFGDHMVLQQEATLPVWGWAAPGEKVTVTVGTESASATAGADGKWMVKLPPLPNGTAPTTMTVAGTNTLTFTDVLVGEVWLCSGQSNMARPLPIADDAATEIPKANDPQLRFFVAQGLSWPREGSLQPESNVNGKWQLCTPDTAKTFSAVGYFFGHELRASLNRPVGLISSAMDSTSAQAWTDLATLESDPALQHYADEFKKIAVNFPGGQADYMAAIAAHQSDMEKWYASLYADPAYKAWQAACAQAKAAHKPLPPQPPAPNPVPIVPPSLQANEAMVPTCDFNGRINPFIPYAIKGVIWYQGEANCGMGMEYRTLFGKMITSWREKWGEGNFPFLFVQLASYNSGPIPSMAYLRESQLKTLALPNTGMATAIDISDYPGMAGGNIHPPDKHDVGRRLVLAARHVAYGQDLVYSGPMYDSFQVEGGTIRVKYTQTGSGLVIARPPWVNPLAPPWPVDKLVGFEIAGADGKYVPADAKIDGNSVVVSSPQITQPVYVRYAWANDVWINLYNKEGLPALPFRTDNFMGPGSDPMPPPPAPAAPAAK